MLVLDWKVLGQDVVRSSDNELVDFRKKLRQALVAFLQIRICASRISTSQDRYLILLSELQPCAQIPRIGEIQQSEVLRQIVLDRRARQNDALLDVQTIERLERLTLAILQAMALITKHQADLVPG